MDLPGEMINSCLRVRILANLTSSPVPGCCCGSAAAFPSTSVLPSVEALWLLLPYKAFTSPSKLLTMFQHLNA